MSRTDDPTDHGAVDEEGPLRKERIDIQRKVSLKFKEFRGFITEFSENISTGGMFIRTTRPQPPGSIFDFEFTLGEDYTLIHGLGEVVWVRDKDEGFDRPAGMGVRFLSLDPDSRRLIDEIVARRLENGGGDSEADLLAGWGMGESDAVDQGAAPAGPPAEPGGLFGPLDAPAAPAAPAASGASGEPADSAADDTAGGSGQALPDLSALVGGERPETSAADAEQLSPSSSVSPYARSYHSYHAYQSGSAGRSRGLSDLLSWRPLGVVLIVVVAVVILAAGFFLLAPDKAMELLVGSSGGDEEVAAATPEPGPGVIEVPAVEAEGDGASQDAAPTAGGAPSESGGATGAGPGTDLPSAAPAQSADGSAEQRSAPAPSEPLPQEPEGEPFTRILNITYDQRGPQVVVTIHFDGVVREWDYSLTRINAPPPRELVRIRGAREPFQRTTIPVTSDLIDRIRTGFHPRDGEDEIHVVIDLASPDVVLERSEAAGDEIRLYLGREEDRATEGAPSRGRGGA